MEAAIQHTNACACLHKIWHTRSDIIQALPEAVFGVVMGGCLLSSGDF